MKGRLVVVTLAVSGAVVPAAAPLPSKGPCPAFCGQRGGPMLLAVSRIGAGRIRADVFLRRSAPLELQVARFAGGRLVGVKPTVISQHPRVTLMGRAPIAERREQIVTIRIGAMRAGVRSRTIRVVGRGRSLAPGDYILTVMGETRRGPVRGSSIVLRAKRDERILYLLQADTAPDALSDGASAVTQTGAVIGGTLDTYGQRTRYFFEYGSTTAYGWHTASQTAGAGRKPVRVSVGISGLSFATTYHYRLVATVCSGCRWGTSYGQDRTVVTLPGHGLSTQQIDADRAIAAYNAMQQYFYAGDGSSLYTQNSPQSGNPYSYLWPFSRALAGTITLAGVPPELLGGASYAPDVSDRLVGLSRFWDGTGYDSYPAAPYGKGGDKYYDDQAWVGLSSAQSYRLTGDPVSLTDAQNAFSFVYPGGWAASATFDGPGGIYWVNQGVGVGVGNHDRTTTSNAPNAELGLLLGNLDPGSASTYDADAGAIYGWVNQYLYNTPTSPNYQPAQPALMFDKVRGNDTIDETLWTYNQGTMIAASVREYQVTGQPTYLSEAEAIANAALNTFTESSYVNQPAAFDAVFFRGLLVLYSATSDMALRSRIVQTIQAYADDAWANYRAAPGLFRFPSSSGTGYQLLDQGAMVEIYAALAWNPADYDKLP
jgi:Glycosyl hydrolase family 76